MRQIISLTWLQLRLIKGAALAMLGLPLLFTFIFGMLMGGDSDSATQTYPVAVVDQDASFASARLIEALGKEKSFKVRPAAEEDLRKMFSDKAISSALVITPGFQSAVAAGQAPEVKLVTAPGNNLHLVVGPAARRLTSAVASDYRQALRLAGSSADEARVGETYREIVAKRQKLTIPVESRSVGRTTGSDQSKASNLSERALGFTVMFVMAMVFMMSGAILQERQTGTWGRLLTTPTGRLSLLSGFLLSFFATGMLQFGILVAATALLFKVSWGPLLPLVSVAAALVLCASGMGLFLAGIVRTAEQQNVLGNIFVTATSMLGGAFWPLEIVGDTMRRIAYLTPQAWAMEGFREVMLRGASWNSLFWPLGVLLALTTIFMTAGLFKVRYE